MVFHLLSSITIKNYQLYIFTLNFFPATQTGRINNGRTTLNFSQHNFKTSFFKNRTKIWYRVPIFYGFRHIFKIQFQASKQALSKHSHIGSSKVLKWLMYPNSVIVQVFHPISSPKIAVMCVRFLFALHESAVILSLPLFLKRLFDLKIQFWKSTTRKLSTWNGALALFIGLAVAEDCNRC